MILFELEVNGYGGANIYRVDEHLISIELINNATNTEYELTYNDGRKSILRGCFQYIEHYKLEN